MSSITRFIALSILVLTTLSAAVVWAKQNNSQDEENYESSEQILQDSAVSFPVDI